MREAPSVVATCPVCLGNLEENCTTCFQHGTVVVKPLVESLQPLLNHLLEDRGVVIEIQTKDNVETIKWMRGETAIYSWSSANDLTHLGTAYHLVNLLRLLAAG